MNLARLKPWLLPLAPYQNPPMAHLSLSNQAEYVRTTLRLSFPQPHAWRSEPWNIPPEIIREPLVGPRDGDSHQ